MRMTINEIEKFISKLESTKYVGGVVEQEKRHAISCLKIMLDDMDFREIKSLKIEQEGGTGDKNGDTKS